MKILFKLPSRERPEKLFAAIDNIISMSVTDNYVVQLTLDADDPTMANDKVRNRIMDYGNKVIAYYGFSTGKINACNRDCEFFPPFDILVLFSDDMVFTQYGFDSFLIEDMQKNFPDLDGVLHYDDGTPAKDKLITMSIMGRTYFNLFGYLYSPEYHSVYADNHFTEVARGLGKYKFIKRKLFVHQHPAWGTAKSDDLYKRNEDKAIYQKDKETYFKNLNNNFGLK